MEKYNSNLFQIIQKFKKYNAKVSVEEYNSIYFKKTSDRIDEVIADNEIFKDIFEEDFIIINGEKLKNWSLMKSDIQKRITKMYKKEDNSLIHGDLYFSNIFMIQLRNFSN